MEIVNPVEADNRIEEEPEVISVDASINPTPSQHPSLQRNFPDNVARPLFFRDAFSDRLEKSTVYN